LKVLSVVNQWGIDCGNSLLRYVRSPAGVMMTMSARDSNKVVKQIGSLCLLFSVINGLPDTRSRRRFLLSNDLDNPEIKEKDLENCLKVLYEHRHYRRYSFKKAFDRGVNGVHLVYYLRHLVRSRVIKSFVYNKLGDNIRDRIRILKKIINGEEQNRGKVFILTGFSTSNKDKLNILKRLIRKRPTSGEQEVHVLNLLLSKAKVKKSGEHYSCHAVCLKVDMEGNCWLYDPGKITVKRISFELDEFEKLIDSLFDIYLVHKLEIKFE